MKSVTNVLTLTIYIFFFFSVFFWKEYVKRLNVLKAASKDLLFRVSEMRDRPVMLDTLKSLLNHTEYFYKNLYNHTLGDDPVFTQVEVNTLGKLINETYVSN